MWRNVHVIVILFVFQPLWTFRGPFLQLNYILLFEINFYILTFALSSLSNLFLFSINWAAIFGVFEPCQLNLIVIQPMLH